MNEDESSPRPKGFVPRSLDALGEEELSAYIVELRAEIIRAEAAIDIRRIQKQAAAAFFRKP